MNNITCSLSIEQFHGKCCEVFSANLYSYSMRASVMSLETWARIPALPWKLTG